MPSGCKRGEERLSLGLRDLELLDELSQGLWGDVLAAGELFQLFVGLIDSESAHHGLDGFGENRMRRGQIGRDAVGIDRELSEPAECRSDGEQAMSDSDAHVSQRTDPELFQRRQP